MMGLKCGVVSLTILTVLMCSQGSLADSISATCHPQSVCALRESAVNLTCSYPYTNIRTGFWFSANQKATWRNKDHPEDLILDADYAGRVSYTETTSTRSTLTITDLRQSDSGKYQLMLITVTGQKYLSSSTVTLTVTDVQMSTYPSKNVYLSCTTSCNVTSKPSYYRWFWNGQHIQNTSYIRPQLLAVSADNSGSYSCSVDSLNTPRSPAVCVFDQNCWNVTYAERSVCALEGSSVKFPCTYSYPSNDVVGETTWERLRPSHGSSDGSIQQFDGRVEYDGDKKSSLIIKDLRKSDSGEYYFRFNTLHSTLHTSRGMIIGRPGIVVKVTGLQVRMSLTTVSEGQTAILSCGTICTLPNSPTYIWYKNEQIVTNKPTKDNKLYLKCKEDAGNYSCAVRGREELQSPPVNLVADKCAEVQEESPALNLVAMVLSVFLFVILIIGALWMCSVIRRKRRAKRDTGIKMTQDDTYAKLNPENMSSDYDTLAHVTGSSSNTYAALNPKTISSDYDILKPVTGSSSNTYAALNPETISSDYDIILKGVHSSPDKQHKAQRSAPATDC